MTIVDLIGYCVLIGLLLSIFLALPKIGNLVGWKMSALSLVATFALYVIYEITMPESMNIRVDRFFLWPALLLVFLFVIFRISQLRKT